MLLSTQTQSVALKAKLFRGLADSSRLSILDALRDGDVFSRGNGFIGRVSRSVFDKLTAVAGKDQDEALGAAPEKAGL